MTHLVSVCVLGVVGSPVGQSTGGVSESAGGSGVGTGQVAGGSWWMPWNSTSVLIYSL